jgi:hypothetical protein
LRPCLKGRKEGREGRREGGKEEGGDSSIKEINPSSNEQLVPDLIF